MHDYIYLASQSPRRRQLLEQIGVRHELLLAGPDEDAEALEAEQALEAPRDYVERVTRAKLRAAQRRLKMRGLPEAPILCADTTVAVGRRILGKPIDAADAHRMLSQLSGRSHHVFSAVALAWGRHRACSIHVSRVWFAPLTAQQIELYVDSLEPLGKAGAYAIQSLAACWITRIDGSYSAIMGLPLYETAELMKQARVRLGTVPN